MCTRNRLSLESAPVGLSSCLEMPLRHSFSSARSAERMMTPADALVLLAWSPNKAAMPTPSTSASVASTRSDGEERPRSTWLRKPTERSLRLATASSERAALRRRSRSRLPTARSIAGSVGLAFALDAALPILLPRLDENTRFHVHENRLPSPAECDHNFILVKIAPDRPSAKPLSDHIARSRRRETPRRSCDALQASCPICASRVVAGRRPACFRATGPEGRLDPDRGALHLPRHQDQRDPGRDGRSDHRGRQG